MVVMNIINIVIVLLVVVVFFKNRKIKCLIFLGKYIYKLESVVYYLGLIM